jgi:hypothetical protein
MQLFADSLLCSAKQVYLSLRQAVFQGDGISRKVVNTNFMQRSQDMTVKWMIGFVDRIDMHGATRATRVPSIVVADEKEVAFS